MSKMEALTQIIEEEMIARKEAYKGYCNELIYEWGDKAIPMTFEEWEKEFEELGGWETYI